MVKLQWGRRNSPAETRTSAAAPTIRSLRFNGAAGIHRRKRGQPTPTAVAPRSFNGAAGIHRRKRDWLRGLFGAGGEASMGPPEFTGGNLAEWILSTQRV